MTNTPPQIAPSQPTDAFFMAAVRSLVTAGCGPESLLDEASAEDRTSDLSHAAAACVAQDFLSAEQGIAETKQLGLHHEECLILESYVWHKKGRSYDAVSRLSSIQPSSPMWLSALLMKGRIHMDIASSGPAEEILIQAADVAPDCATPWRMLAALAQTKRKLERGIQYAQEVLTRVPGDVYTLTFLGDIYERLSVLKIRGATAEGVDELRRNSIRYFTLAIEARPTAAAFVRRGRMEYDREDYDAAIRSFEGAVRIEADCVTALECLGNIHMDAGDTEAAKEYLNRALRIDETLANVQFRHARIGKACDTEQTRARIEMLKKQIRGPETLQEERILYHFAAAKLSEDIQCFDDAWEHYNSANRLKPGHSSNALGLKSHSRTQYVAIIKDSLRHLDSEFFTQHEQHGNPSPLPVFVIGMPRSGTTLTEQILSAHPQVFGAGELPEAKRMYEHVMRRQQPGTLSKVLNSISRTEAEEVSSSHLDYLKSFVSEEVRVVDKMPTNFIYVGMLAFLFPNAKFIHCRRDPRDVLTSCMCQNLSPPFCDLAQMVAYYNAYDRLMEHWEAVLPGRIFTTDYENVVEDLETHARGMIDHLGLEWHPGCLQFQDNERFVRTPSKFQVRQPVYRTSVGRWKRYESHLEEYFEHLRLPDRYCAAGDVGSAEPGQSGD